MKKNTVKMFVAGLFLAATVEVSAQTAEQRKQITKDYDIEAMQKQAEEFSSEWHENYAKALELAKINGWPLDFETKDGNFAQLVGIKEDGTPLYFQTLNANAAFTSGISSLYNGGGLGVDITGEGMIAGVWDQTRPRTQHNTFDGRLDAVDTATEINNHPTHVCGTVLGSGLGSPSLNARGMAYEAQGFAYDWFSDTEEMQNEAAFGLLVSNHSYGTIASAVADWEWGAYTSQSRSYDIVAFNAKKYLIVQAAGNDRGDVYNTSKGGYDLINGTKTAKNALTVAAVNGLSSAYSDPSQVVMSSFSSWGPTDDNRIKPDISAKGVNVISSVVNGASNSTYGPLSGTSMASPVVTGGALLLQQLYNQENGDYARSATIRGLICHTADEAGFYDGPDPMFGWGLFDAKKAAQAILNNGVSSYIFETQKANGSGNYEFNIDSNGTGPLQVSITWTDPAGSATNNVTDSTTPKLVNNLDLRVVKDGVTYYPWKLGVGYEDPAEKGDNNVDNIERIDIENPSGQYKVVVSHKNNIVSGPQQYTIIVTNATYTTGTDKNEANVFSMWPNPAQSEVNINLAQGGNASAVFYDIQGRVVLNAELTLQQSAIDTNMLSEGVYMVKVTQDGKEQVKKVVINK